MSDINIKTIHTIPGVSFEEQQKDEVYSNRITDFDNIGEDKHYGKPDYEVSIFSTTNLKVKSIFPNNLSTYIRPKENLKYLGQNRKISDELLEGVFIVENFNFYTDSGTDISHIYDTIFTRDDLDINHIEVEKIKEYLSRYDRTTYHDKGVFTIRLVSFIDVSILKDNVDVYVANQRMLLSIREDVSNLRHPLSTNYTNDIEDYKGSNVITIDLIDNDRHHQEPLYTKLGNSIIKILPRVDKLKPDGLYRKICKEGVTTDDTYIPYEDINDIGVYNSYKLALFNGNVDNEINMTKIALEDKKLIIDENKHELELKKIENEKLNMIRNRISDYTNVKTKILDLESNMSKVHDARIDSKILHDTKMEELNKKIQQDEMKYRNEMQKLEIASNKNGKSTVIDNIVKVGTLITKII